MPVQKTITTNSLSNVLSDLIRKVASDTGVSNSLAERLLNPVASDLANIAGVSSSNSPYLSEKVNEISNYLMHIQDFVKFGVGNILVQGLDVIASDPPSNQIRITSGFCYIEGQRIDHPRDEFIDVDLSESDDYLYVFINQAGVIGVSVDIPDLTLVLARIDRQSSFSTKIQDNSLLNGGNESDAYIASAKDPLFDNNHAFDDDSVAALKNSLQFLFAENIFGTIKIHEGLTVENVQGSLAMDSKQVLIKDPSGNTLSKFNANGTFYYNSEGQEFAHYGRDGARVGNIKITPSTLESVNFSLGSAGFQIKANGNAEFNDITVRGTIYSSQGEIGGWSIGATKLTGGQTELDSLGIIKVGTANDVAILSSNDPTYRHWIGNANPLLASFHVKKDGSFYSVKGLIGGFTIDATTLQTTNLIISSGGGGQITAGNVVITGGTSTIDVGTGIDLVGLADGSINVGSGIQISGAGGGTISVGSGVQLDGTAQSITATVGQLGGWTLANTKLYATDVDIISSSGGSIRVGDILLTGSTSKIDVGSAIDIIGTGSGSINVASVIDIDGATGSITLSGGGSFIAGDTTLNSQGLTINGTYSSVSIGTGNSNVKINNSDGIYLGHATKASAPFSVSMAGELKAVLGQIAGWNIVTSKLFSTNIDIDSSSGGSIKVGDILLTGSTSRIDVGSAVDIIGTGFGSILIGSGITMDGQTATITLSSSGSFIAGDTTLNSQGLTINGTYSTVSIGTGNNIIKINNSDGIYLGHTVKASAPFSVSMQGELKATFGEIASWTISTDKLSAPANALILDAANKRIDVGNTIRIDGLNERVESTNYASGVSGWRIDGNGDSEFRNCVIRGQLHTAVFVKDQIHATNGQLLVTDAATLINDIDSTQTKIYITEGLFLSGDRLRMKDGLVKDEKFKVTGVGSDGGGNFITVTRNFDGGGSFAWNKGTTVVSIESRVSLVASGFANLPYIDIIERTGDFTESVRARLGNLNGISGATGFGLWSENVFLTGQIVATSGAIANWDIVGNQIQSSNDKIILDSATEKITVNTIIIDGANNKIDVGSFIDIDGNAGGQIIVGSVNDVYLDGATGKIFAKNGEVGGWVLSSTYLKSDTGTTPIITLNKGTSANITITNGSTTQVIVGKYDGSNFGIKAGDAVLDSSGLTISGTSSSISLGTGNSILKINNSDGIFLGNAIKSLAPFHVSMAGVIKAVSGTIANWTLATDKFSSTNVEINSSSGGSITVGNIVMTGSTSRIDVGSAIDIIGTGGGTIQVGSGITMDGANQRITLSGSGQFIAGDATLSSTGLTISGTQSSISLGTGNSIVKINNFDGLYLGNSVQTSAPFSVTMAGVLKAISGTIGGWTLSSTTLSSSNVELNNSGTVKVGTSNDIAILSSVDPTYRLWVGHATSGSAPFRVNKNGNLIASNADITGTIKATSGYIGSVSNGWSITSNALTNIGTGVIQTSASANTGIKLDASSFRGYDSSNNQRFKLAADGSGFLGSGTTITWNTSGVVTIGGFTVNNSSLTAGSGSTSVGVSATGSFAFYAGNATPGSAPFRVNFNGQLIASNAVITGDISCNTLTASTSGNVAGWDISASALTSNGGTIRTSSSATVNGITLDNTGLRGYGSGIQKFALTASDGRLFANEADIGRKITKITSTSNVGSAINAAISQFGSDGGIIYIPSGVYRLDTTINMADNVTIRGSGPDQTRLVPDLNMGSMIAITWNVDNVEILDLEMDANYNGYTANTCMVMTGSGGIENLRLKNCVFRDALVRNVDFSYAGREQIEGCVFHVASGAVGVYGATNVRECEFNGSGTGAYACGVVSNCEFNNNSIGVNYALQLVNNRFYNCGTCYLQQFFSEGNIIRGNLFKDYSSRGVSFTSRNFLFTITDNVFQSGAGIAIDLDSVFSGIISNNNFYEHSGSYIIYCSNTSTENLSHAPSLNIIGNMVYRCTVSSGFFDINLAHYLDDKNSLIISNNNIKSCTVTGTGRGIKTYDPNAMISNNVITEVILTSTSASFYFIDCYQMANVSGNTLAHIDLQSGASNFITGITFNWVDSIFNGNLIWLEASTTSTIRGFYKQGGAERTMYNNNSIYVKNTGSGNGEAFNVSISEGVAVGNNYNGSDSLGTLSISAGVVANNNG